MKKITNIFVFLMIGFLVSLPIRVSIAHAEDNGGGDRKGQEIKNSNGHDQEDGDKEDEIDEDGQTSREHDIFSFLLQDIQKTPAVNLPEVKEASIVTYADVLTVLKSYDAAIAQISVNAGVNTNNTTLSATEKALLSGLVNKHHNQFDRLNNRITEVSAQLKQLEDLLAPLGTQPVSSLYGIKGLLIDELNNYRDIINGISEFDSLNVETLQSETD